MSTAEVSPPESYQASLRRRRLDLRASVGALSEIICNATIAQQTVIAEMITVTAELNERWQYHLTVHQPNDLGRCDECDEYDPAGLVPPFEPSDAELPAIPQQLPGNDLELRV